MADEKDTGGTITSRPKTLTPHLDLGEVGVQDEIGRTRETDIQTTTAIVADERAVSAHLTVMPVHQLVVSLR